MNFLYYIASFSFISFSLAQGIVTTENVTVDSSRDTKVVTISGESAKVIYDFLNSKESITGDSTTKNGKEVSCSKLNNNGGYICTTTISKKGKFYNF